MILEQKWKKYHITVISREIIVVFVSINRIKFIREQLGVKIEDLITKIN